MTEEERAKAALETRLGAQPDSSFWGGDTARAHAWTSGAYAPLPTVGQYADVTGYSPERAALPNQYETKTSLEPSSVPHYDAQYKEGPSLGPGPSRPRSDREVLEGLNPQGSNFLDVSRTPVTEDYAGPGAPSLQPPSMRNTPQPQLRANYQGVTGSLDRPPVGGPLQPQAGPSQEINRTSINRQAPINTAQNDLYQASIHRQQSPYYDRPVGGAGANTYDHKVLGLAQAFMNDDPTMPLTDAMARANKRLSGETGGQDLALNRRNIEGHRSTHDQQKNRQLDIQERYTNARIDHMKYVDQQAKDMAARGMSPQDIALMRVQESHKFHQAVVTAWMNQHANLPEDEKQAGLADLLSFIADNPVSPTTSMPSKFPDYMGGGNVPFTGGQRGFTPPPGERKGGLRPPTSQGTQPSPEESAGTASERLKGVTSQFQGAPAGKAPGDTLKQDGKPVARWDGKTWQAIQ